LSRRGMLRLYVQIVLAFLGVLLTRSGSGAVPSSLHPKTHKPGAL
jgi:hypothetical protein